VDRFASGEPRGGGGAVSAAEYHYGEQPLVVQLRGEGRHAKVVAAKANGGCARPPLMVHLVVVPDGLGVIPVRWADAVLLAAHEALLAVVQVAAWRMA
jgi:hypothetical protein